VFGTYLEKKLGTDIYEFLTLTNTTNQRQKYHLLISQHFVTDIPLDGELPGNSSLVIPLRLNQYYFTLGIGVQKDDITYGAMGSITVIDHNPSGNVGFVSSSLLGMMNDLVAIETRQSAVSLSFFNEHENESLSRKLLIRNCTCNEVVWEGGIGTMESKSLMRKAFNSSAGDWCPFSISATRLNLKPFEVLAVDLKFQASSSGTYDYKLFMEYRDNVKHSGTSDRQILEPSRPLKALLLHGKIGRPNFEICPSLVVFENTLPGWSSVQDITVSNKGSSLALNLVVSESDVIKPDALLTVVNPQEKLKVPICFRPCKSGATQSLISMATLTGWSTVFCLGQSSKAHLEACVVDFRSKKIVGTVCVSHENDTANLNVGNMFMGEKKKFYVALRNCGTSILNIRSITSEGNCDFFVVNQYSRSRGIPNLESRFQQPDSLDTDLDEIDLEREGVFDTFAPNSLKKPQSLRRLNRSMAGSLQTVSFDSSPFVRVLPQQSIFVVMQIKALAVVS
jgi:hypothetical protein